MSGAMWRLHHSLIASNETVVKQMFTPRIEQALLIGYNVNNMRSHKEET